MKNVVNFLSILLLASCVVFTSCTKEDVKVTGVTLSKTEATLEVGEDITLTATVAPDNAADKAVTWETSDDEIAVVDQSGKVTAKGVGKATITVKTKDGNHTATCKVTVEIKMEDNFEIEAKASISTNATVFDLSQMTINGQLGAGVMVFDTMGSFLSMPNDASLILSVKNTSGKVIPAGTPWKFRFKRNNVVLTQVWVLQGGQLIQQPLTTEGTLAADLGIGETFILFQEPFRIHRSMDDWGSNSFCVEVLQFGKTSYPAPKTDCYNYQIIGK